MDELWQKYRAFWVPVLWGLGAFLVGLIVVHLFTGDAEAGRRNNDSAANRISKLTAPTGAQIEGARRRTEALRERVASWAKRLDQRRGASDDPLEAYVAQALQAAVLRGSPSPDESRFDGDRVAASQAALRYEQLMRDRVQLLRTQDPNVSFSRLKADVVQELMLRANRADVDVGPTVEELGFSAVASVDRAELPRRCANLALVATVADLAIREGVRSFDSVTLILPESRLQAQGADAFLQEWPVEVEMTGPPETFTALLNLLTDPTRPTPIGTASWKASTKKDGLVRVKLKLYSIQVRPDAPLGLESEGGE